jgi:hypothetical protein
MTKAMGVRRREQLVADILAGEHDVLALGERHKLKPHKLAAWAIEPENHRVLRGLCVLADLQTQLVLSRYRRLAAGRLIRLATDEGDEKAAEVSRKACVDLLRLDMKRADAVAARGESQTDDADAAGPEGLRLGEGDASGDELSRLLYDGE